MAEGMENVIPFAPKGSEGGDEREGKILEFKRKIAEEVPEPGMELREQVEVRVTGEELHAILVGLTKERRDLKAQLAEIQADPELESMLGGMVQGLLEKNGELMARLASKNPLLEKHFKNALE